MDKEKEKKNDLVIDLMKEKGKNEIQMAALTGKNPSVFYKITGKRNAPTDATLTLIASALKIDESYWETGIIKPAESKENKITASEPWKDEAYANLKEEKEYFKSNYERLKSKYDTIVEGLLAGKKPSELNFLPALKKAASDEAVDLSGVLRVLAA